MSPERTTNQVQTVSPERARRQGRGANSRRDLAGAGAGRHPSSGSESEVEGGGEREEKSGGGGESSEAGD